MSKHKPQADHITTTKTANVNPNSLPGLPAELLLTIADCLDSGLDRPYSGLDDINRLAQTNIYLYSVLNDYIYRFEIKHNNGLALLWAAENDREATLLRMLSLGADVNTTEGPNMIWAHWTPLLYAAKENHPSIVKILLSRPDIDVNARLPESQQTALSIASQEGWTNVVSLLIAHPSTDLEATEGKHGQTPLSLAAERGYDDIVALFLNNTTADPDPPSTSTGQTPLSYAVHHGHLDVVSLLLASPFVDPHSKDTQFGCTPLMWASRCGYVPIVTLLLSAPGLEIDYADTGRQTALSHAISGTAANKTAIAKLLLDAGASPNAHCGQYGNVLQTACYDGHLQAAHYLLDAGADPNAPGSKTYGTALQIAAWKGHFPLVKLLLESGADVHAKASFYGTALEAAARGSTVGNVKARKMLAEYGARVASREGGGGDEELEEEVRIKAEKYGMSRGKMRKLIKKYRKLNIDYAP